MAMDFVDRRPHHPCMAQPFPCSPYQCEQGLFYFPRMLEKIRLLAAGELHPDLHANLGKGFDDRCAMFLAVDYEALRAKVLEGLTDEQALDWCFENGKRPNEDEIEIWNAFMSKRGWNDAMTETLIRRKKESGFESRDEIQTMFQYIDADEGRA